MLGIPYTLYKEGHVRVDIIYESLSLRKQAWIDLFGTIFLLIPFTVLVANFGIDFTLESYQLGETSGDPGGLSYRWLIKAVIPFAFISIGISGIGLALKSINTLRNDPNHTNKEHHQGTHTL
jgi:TRAP-type mannitol/chloroaromatic compound transport system permease small subunit